MTHLVQLRFDCAHIVPTVFREREGFVLSAVEGQAGEKHNFLEDE